MTTLEHKSDNLEICVTHEPKTVPYQKHYDHRQWRPCLIIDGPDSGGYTGHRIVLDAPRALKLFEFLQQHKQAFEAMAEQDAIRCPLCGNPKSKEVEAHPDCIKAYGDYWNERTKEMQYRSSLQQPKRLLSSYLTEEDIPDPDAREVPTLPAYVHCPLCHAIFTTTPELLESTRCSACNQEFDYDDKWEYPG